MMSGARSVLSAFEIRREEEERKKKVEGEEQKNINPGICPCYAHPPKFEFARQFCFALFQKKSSGVRERESRMWVLKKKVLACFGINDRIFSVGD